MVSAMQRIDLPVSIHCVQKSDTALKMLSTRIIRVYYILHVKGLQTYACPRVGWVMPRALLLCIARAHRGVLMVYCSSFHIKSSILHEDAICSTSECMQPGMTVVFSASACC